MAKAARLNSNRFRRPTAQPIDELTTAIREEGAPRLIFDQALRFAPRTPCHQTQASSGLSESCPKNADVPKSPFPCSGSPGAVGRHNNTQNRAAFGCGRRKHPRNSVRVRVAQRASHASKGRHRIRGGPREARHSRAPNFDIAKAVQNRNGSAPAQLRSVTQQRRRMHSIGGGSPHAGTEIVFHRNGRPVAYARRARPEDAR
jgi:hypothetical protein